MSPTPPPPAFPTVSSASLTNRTSLLDRVEGSKFFTNKNITTLLAAGILSSIVLAALIPTHRAWVPIPIFAYAVVNLGLLLIHVRGGRVRPQRILLTKAASDILFTVYWINVFAWETGSTQFYFLPVLMLTAITLYNARQYRARVLSLGLYALVMLNGYAFAMLVGIEKIGAIGMGVYYVLAVHAIWAHRTHSALGATVHKEVATAEARIDDLVNTGKTLQLAARIVKHDISNLLLGSASFVPTNQGRAASMSHRKAYQDLASGIEDLLQLLLERGAIEVELYRPLRGVMPLTNSCIDVERDVFVKVPFLMLVSFFRNICDNAQEAYLRTHASIDGFRLTAKMQGSTLEIEDNAGGFDVGSVAMGMSSRGENHGRFLATFLNDTRHLGLTTGLERTANGTIVRMTFETVIARHIGNAS